MVKLFLGIYDYFSSHKKAMWAVLALSVVLAVGLSFGAKVKEDITDFLPADKENRDVNWAFSHIGAANKVLITLSMDGPENDRDVLMDAVDTLEEAIYRNVPAEYISSVMARVDDDSVSEVTDFIVSHLPYYMTEQDYERVDSLMNNMDDALKGAKSIIVSPIGGMMKGVVTKDPLFVSANRLKSLEGFKTTSSVSTIDDYIFTDDGSALVTLDLAFSSSDTFKAGKFISAMDKALEECENAFEGTVKADPLGSVFIAHTNSSTIKRDSIISILIAVVLIALFLISFFRSGKSILLVGATILYGFLIAFSLTSLIMGSLSLIVLGMGAVIIGIAANYPLHFISHIKQGYTPRESLQDIVLPLTTGNITTVGAFLSLLFIASPAMKDLGLFAALLLVGTILFTLIFLPHLTYEEENKEPAKVWDSFSKLSLGTSKWALIGVVVLTVFFSFFDENVKFDSNLHNINYMTERQKANMGKMLSLGQGNRCVSYVAVKGATMDEALDNYIAVSADIDSLAGILPEDAVIHALHDFVPSASLQRERLQRWNAFVAENGEELLIRLNDAARANGFSENAFKPFEDLLLEDYEVLDYKDFALITDNLAPGYLIGDENQSAIVSSVGTSEDETEKIEEYFEGRENVIVFDSSSMTERMVASLSEEFDTVLYICAFIVFALLVISFGRLEIALIAFLPLTIAWIWILGLMGLSGIDFNIINIILATFIFGMGDDYTIFITEGVMYEHTYGRKMLSTYERTIALSALIMFVGIGSLIVAKHPAMRSLAEVIMIGMMSVVLVADILPPFLYRFLTMKKGKKRKEPLTIKNFGATLMAFVVFLVGALIITVAGVFLITCTFGSKKGKYLYHCLLCKISGFVFRNVFYTTHTIECNEKFEKPAIIVANHESHLDLMALLQLTPKMVVVTNKWVWNNPLYGILIRYADFCPVENVLTDDLSKIEAMIADGYSVLVFPEGTRSPDGRIGRYHKGAFFLAQKYGLDILPVVIHGLNDVLPKEDLLLRKGHMDVKVMDRIAASEDYVSMSKSVRKMMMAEYDAIASKVENVDYFADRVIHNYIYKGADVERSVRKSMRDNANFKDLAESLPAGGRVLFRESGYGESALVCALARKDVTIDALISDEMTRLLAANCVGVPSNLKYVSSPEGDYDKEYEV